MSKKPALGRGLSALLEHSDLSRDTAVTPPTPSSENTVGKLAGGYIAMLSISQIEANPYQPREKFSDAALKELATSIRSYGIIQPVTVRKISANKYQLISGERRFRASQLAELEEIPAYIREANDQSMLEMALVENIQRENLDAIEVAISYKRLIDECNLTQEALSDRVGKDRSTVANYLRLLKLPAEIQVGIIEKQITMGHARALVNAGDEKRQIDLFRKIIREGLSVRQTEELAKNSAGLTGEKAASKKQSGLSFSQQKYFEDLKEKFGKSVKLQVKDDGTGKIELPFNDEQELRKIMEAFEL
jgi:ParB family chromosome partitioning protein